MTAEATLGAPLYLPFGMTVIASIGKRGMQDISDDSFSAAAMRVMTGKTLSEFTRIIDMALLQILRLMAGQTDRIRFALEQLAK